MLDAWTALFRDNDPAGFDALNAASSKEQRLLSDLALAAFKLNGRFLELAEELARPGRPDRCVVAGAGCSTASTRSSVAAIPATWG